MNVGVWLLPLYVLTWIVVGFVGVLAWHFGKRLLDHRPQPDRSAAFGLGGGR